MKRTRWQARHHDALVALGLDAEPKANKYKAQKVKWFGHTFDSKKEGEYYLHLRDWQKHGRVRDLELQPCIPIIIGGIPVCYPNGRQMVFTADFRFLDCESEEIMLVDVKSEATSKERGYRITRALLHTMGIKLTEV